MRKTVRLGACRRLNIICCNVNKRSERWEKPEKSGWKIALLTGVAVAGAAFLLPHTVPAEAASVPKMLSELKRRKGRPAGVYLKKAQTPP